MPHRLHQVRLAEPGLAVEEQRVVRVARGRRHGLGGRRGEVVVRPDHEVVEDVLGVELGQHPTGAARHVSPVVARLRVATRCARAGREPVSARTVSARTATAGARSLAFRLRSTGLAPALLPARRLGGLRTSVAAGFVRGPEQVLLGAGLVGRDLEDEAQGLGAYLLESRFQQLRIA